MYIYIDPKMIGMGSGVGANDVSAARVLGLGGYYFVNKVSNSINSEGNFETQLEASFNSFGPPDCRLRDLQVFSPQLDASEEIGDAELASDESAPATTDPRANAEAVRQETERLVDTRLAFDALI